MEKLTAKASIQIQKPVSQVFNAVVTAQGMSRYFIEAATGDLRSGETVTWKFPEFEDLFPVTAKEIKENDYVSFDWSGGEDGMFVEIFFLPQEDDSTVVKITEHFMEKDDEGIMKLMRQTEGWANFLACLKASLEYGINLRKGAFDFMRLKK